MTTADSSSFPFQVTPPVDARPCEQTLPDVESLTWQLLDSPSDSAAVIDELNQALQDSTGARSRYLQAVQLHCDLLDYFGQWPSPPIVP